MGKLWFSSGVMWAVCWQSMGSFGLPFYLQRVSVVRLGTEPKICGTICLQATLSSAVVGPSAS